MYIEGVWGEIGDVWGCLWPSWACLSSLSQMDHNSLVNMSTTQFCTFFANDTRQINEWPIPDNLPEGGNWCLKPALFQMFPAYTCRNEHFSSVLFNFYRLCSSSVEECSFRHVRLQSCGVEPNFNYFTAICSHQISHYSKWDDLWCNGALEKKMSSSKSLNKKTQWLVTYTILAISLKKCPQM
jgi:hypothetical protein